MTDEWEKLPETKMKHAVASLVCSIAATIIAVGAWLSLLMWVVGILVAVALVLVDVSLLVPIFALAIYAWDGSKAARKVAIVAMVLGVLGPVGGCAGGYYALVATTAAKTRP